MPLGASFDDYLAAQIEQDPTLEEELQLGATELELGIQLTKLREYRGLTQRALEELSGIKQPMIARIERAGQDPTVPTLLKLLRALGGSMHISAAGDVSVRPAELDRATSEGRTGMQGRTWVASASEAVSATDVEELVPFSAEP